MNPDTDTVRALYLELRALGLKVSVEEDSDGTLQDYRLVLDGLRSIPQAHVRRVKRKVIDNQEELVRLILDRRDPDLHAIRGEGHCL
ncbi:MAG: hypothetical protein M3518_00225 [Actinomycetota bacterium]|nr:hypothetical protein [Actinomycetota bacterium]